MKRVLQLFRVASVTTMGHTATLESTVTGGVPWKPRRQTPGTGTWATAAPMWTEATAVSKLAFLFGVLVIFELFDNFSI